MIKLMMTVYVTHLVNPRVIRGSTNTRESWTGVNPRAAPESKRAWTIDGSVQRALTTRLVYVTKSVKRVSGTMGSFVKRRAKKNRD